MVAGMMSLLFSSLLLLQAESPGRLIDQLGSDDEAVREKAAKQLEALGKDAIDELRSAVQHCKPRTAALAQKILDAIELRLAPEMLEALRKTLMKPRTCRFKVQVEIDFHGEKKEKHEALADVYFSGIDKARVDSSVRIKNEQDSLSWVCNGKTARRKVGDGDWKEVPAPADIREKTMAAILGLSGPTANPWLNLDFSRDLSKGFSRLAPDPREHRPHLRFRFVEEHGTPEAYAVEGLLLYDPVTSLPKTCRWTLARDNAKAPQRGITTVTWTNFIFDGDLDEKLFNP